MRLIGTIEQIEKLEKVITSYRRCIRLKDTSIPYNAMKGGYKAGYSSAGEPENTQRTYYTKRYEVFAGNCCYIVNFEYSVRDNRGIFRLGEQNMRKFFAIYTEIYDLMYQLKEQMPDERGKYGDAETVKEIDNVLSQKGKLVYSDKFRGYLQKRYTLLYGNLLYVITLRYNMETNFGWVRITERNIDKLYRAIPGLYELVNQLRNGQVKSLTTELILATKGA